MAYESERYFKGHFLHSLTLLVHFCFIFSEVSFMTMLHSLITDDCCQAGNIKQSNFKACILTMGVTHFLAYN